jgi:hypothetical protein
MLLLREKDIAVERPRRPAGGVRRASLTVVLLRRSFVSVPP